MKTRAVNMRPPPNYAQVDASGPDKTRLHEFGVYGQQTLVMFTSIRCGPCQRSVPWFVMLDAQGHGTAQGEAAKSQLNF